MLNKIYHRLVKFCRLSSDKLYVTREGSHHVLYSSQKTIPSAQKTRISNLIRNTILLYLELDRINDEESAKYKKVEKKAEATAKKARLAMIENGYLTGNEENETECRIIRYAIGHHFLHQWKDYAWVFGNLEWC